MTKKKKTDDPDEILTSLKTELYSFAYEKIWEELTENDRELVRLLAGQEEVKREDAQKGMQNPQSYSVYRDRLLRRGIINARRGYVSLALPFFGEYVTEYGVE